MFVLQKLRIEIHAEPCCWQTHKVNAIQILCGTYSGSLKVTPINSAVDMMFCWFSVYYLCKVPLGLEVESIDSVLHNLYPRNNFHICMMAWLPIVHPPDQKAYTPSVFCQFFFFQSWRQYSLTLQIGEVLTRARDIFFFTSLFCRLSGYGFINVGLPPASPSESEEDVVSSPPCLLLDH